MKKIIPLCLAAAAISGLSAHAQDQPKKVQKKAETTQKLPAASHQILVQSEFISLDKDLYSNLLFGDNIKKSGLQLRTELQKLVKDKKAEIIESSLISCAPGKAAKLDSVKKVIYPTEYDPAEVTPAQVSKDGTITKATATPPTPTCFDERPVGSIIECSTKLDAKKGIIDLSIEHELTYYLGKVNWATWKNKQTEVNTSMPKFYNLSYKTDLKLANNQYHIAAVLTPKGKDGKKDNSKRVIVFVRAVALDPSK